MFDKNAQKPKASAHEAPPNMTPKADYLDMALAPADGTHVMLTPDGETEVRALYQKTRKYDHGKWLPTGKWVGSWDRAAITFEPLGWRAAPSEDEIMRGQVEQARKDSEAKRK